MKLPKTFRPEKNLDDKINHLIEGNKKIIPQYSSTLEKYELKELTERIDNPKEYNCSETHSMIEEFLEENNYQKLSGKYKAYEHWTKKDPSDQYTTLIVSKRKQTQPLEYHFARVEEQKLEKYLKKINRYRKLDNIFLNNSFEVIYASTSLAGIGLFGILGMQIGSYIINLELELVRLGGTIGSMIVGGGTAVIISIKYRDKLAYSLKKRYIKHRDKKHCYNEFIIDAKQSLTEAFS